MRKANITVFDYENKIGKGKNHFYEVEAYCVNGDEGVFAIFTFERFICLASGDDGHWWILNVYDKAWLPDIKEALDKITHDLYKDHINGV